MNYTIKVRIIKGEEYIGTKLYDVKIPDDVKEGDPIDDDKVDNVMSSLMDAAREILNEEHEGNEDWENGEYLWSIVDFESF
jgi:hypothetical protein